MDRTKTNPWQIGDTGYLVPTLPTAPPAAYHIPNITVTDRSGLRIEVALPDGNRLWTSHRNVTTRPFQPDSDTKPAAAHTRAPRIALAANEEQPTLW